LHGPAGVLQVCYGSAPTGNKGEIFENRIEMNFDADLDGLLFSDIPFDDIDKLKDNFHTWGTWVRLW